MDKITISNYRCFRDAQSARLAPLTLLVGDNSTGKTSFMAMIRVLEDLAFGSDTLDFKKEPYDLGSFDDIIHYRDNKSRQNEFAAGFHTIAARRVGTKKENTSYDFQVIFGEKESYPIVNQIRFSGDKYWVHGTFSEGVLEVQFGIGQGSWTGKLKNPWPDFDVPQNLARLSNIFAIPPRTYEDPDSRPFIPLAGSPEFSQSDADILRREIFRFSRRWNVRISRNSQHTFASAPVRSKPRRTYDPSRPIPDSEGDYVPMYLANMYFRKEDTWEHLKNKLQEFGRAAGLFDEISIKQLGKRHSEPFQVQIRKFGGPRKKGPSRNLIDVGYGVSQVLPVITELLREDAPVLFLLQQPEVHLHPSAQAALGSLFCQIASPRRQLVVETHSDYLLDRIRIDIREGRTHLRPDDVSILFFERNHLDVTIHSLRIDKEGNILDAPPSYRNFFMEETANLLRL